MDELGKANIVQDPVMKVLNETRCKNCNSYVYICHCSLVDELNTEMNQIEPKIPMKHSRYLLVRRSISEALIQIREKYKLTPEEILETVKEYIKDVERRWKMHFRDIIIHHLGVEDAEHFAKWAVGDAYQTIEGQDWPYLWNELHGNELEIYGFGDINEDIEKMIRIWKKRK